MGHRAGGIHRRLVGTSVALTATVGVALIGVAVTHQQREPEPALTVTTASGRASGALPTRPAVARATGAPTRAPTPSPVTTSPTAPAVRGTVLAASPPIELVIPAIGVRSSLLRLGLAADGTMEVPPRGPTYDRAGWYRYSPTPGSLGPAVLAGHVDSASDGPSVFFRLGDLRPGDRVEVTRADGSVAVFAVDEVRRYSKAGFPTELVYGNVDHAALRLITCGGQFDRASGHYEDDVVVYASLVGRRVAPA